MDSVKDSTPIRRSLGLLVKAKPESPEYVRLQTQLRKELENASSLQLSAVSEVELSAAELAALVEIMEKADVSKLITLNLARNSLEEVNVVKLCKILEAGRFSSLEHLDLSSCTVYSVELDGSIEMEVSKDIAAALGTGHLRSLDYLGLPPCDVPTVVDAMFLGNITGLRHLQLEGSREGDQRSEKMRRIFDGGLLSHVDHLSLCNCSLEADAMEAFGKAVESGQMQKLVYLDLSFNAIRERGSEVLAKLLGSGHLRLLQHLSLFRCEMRDGGMKVIAKAIEEVAMPELVYLNVEENGIADGVVELSTAMKVDHLPKLQTLIIQFNWIGENGMVNLAEVLEEGHCPRLKQLHIFEISVSERSAKAWVSAYVKNDALTVELVKFCWPNNSYKTNAEKHLKRNQAITAARLSLRDEEDVPATTGKVFLCGYEKVGKTTIRKSLQRTWGKSKLIREGDQPTEPRTRGIEISHISCTSGKGKKPVTLAIWDLAAQAEYHVLHSAFCLAEGKATIFVIVFDSLYNRPRNKTTAEQELKFWLRFVASSCVKGATRHVLVALNCIHGHECVEKPQWTSLIKDYKLIFQDMLEIHDTPFALDARFRDSVSPLKKHLTGLSLSLLENVLMPGICREISRHLSSRSEKRTTTNKKYFPVQTLDEFLKEWQRSDHDPKKLTAAVEFLHEAGNVVYFREGNLRNGTDVLPSLLVLDPEWFCQRVVGHLLLPARLLNPSEQPVISEPDGSVLLRNLSSYWELSNDSRQVVYVVAMLRHLGLCYEAKPEKVLVPALITEGDARKWEYIGVGKWTENPEKWVMGRSLTLKDSEKTALPEALFRRLQVALAKEEKFGSDEDSDYTASKSSSTFRASGMIVLIQFDVDDTDPTDDRIDILVKSLVPNQIEPEEVMRKQQLGLIEDIIDLIEPLSINCCPGLQFDIKAIIPWRAVDPTPQMVNRNLVSLDTYKKNVEEHGLGQRTHFTISQDLVMKDDLLSKRDLRVLQATIVEKFKVLKEDLDALEFDFDHWEKQFLEVSDDNFKDIDPEVSLIVKAVHEDGKRTRQLVRHEGEKNRKHLDKRFAEFEKGFRKIFEKQNLLLSKVQAFQSYSIQERESCLPRFMYLTKSTPSNAPSAWIKLKDVWFMSSFELHLLCEARFDDGVFHEVEGQEGIHISNPRKWVRKLRPWLMWSLRIMIIVAKVAGGAVIPGLSIFLPEFPAISGQNIALFVEDVTTLTSEQLDLESDSKFEGESNRSAGKRVDLGQEFLAAAVLNELINEIGHAQFVQKIGLRKAVLMKEDGTPRLVAWICTKCLQSYKKSGLATDITPI